MVIVAPIKDWYELYPSLLKQYPMRKYVRISSHTIKQLITHSCQEKINFLVLNSDSIIRMYSYLFPKNN